MKIDKDRFSEELVDTKIIGKSVLTELITFHNQYHNGNRRNAEWNWQFGIHRPLDTVYSVLKENDQIIATQAMMPTVIQTHCGKIFTGKSEDTLIVPEHRKKDLMSNFYEFSVNLCKQKSMKFIWGFTAAVKAFRKYGFMSFDVFQTYEKPGGNLFPTLFSRLKSREPVWRKSCGCLKYLYNFAFEKIRTKKIEPINEFHVLKQKIEASALSDFYNKIRKRYPKIIIIDYNNSFLNWRIRQHPFLRYEEYQVLKGRNLIAYAIVMLNQNKLFISDIASLDSTATLILINKLHNNYYKKVGNFVVKLNKLNPLSNAIISNLTSFGFKKTYCDNFIIKNLTDKMPDSLNEIENWYLTGLWTLR